MIKLRYYQSDAITGLRESFKKNQRVVLAAPTGSGKTVTFSEMVRLSHQKGTKTLILTDRTELFKQTIKALTRVGVAVEEISPEKKHINYQATIYLAMVETIKRRLSKLDPEFTPSLLIIDEAHKGNFTKILNHFPEAKVIGATASPVGKHFYEYYSDIVQNIDLPELIDEGFLVDYKAYEMRDDMSDLETKRGEFTDHSLMNHFDKPKLYGGVIDKWREYANGLKTICFNVNIKHTLKTHQSFLDAGISSEVITSKTSNEERVRILDAFHKGLFLVLNNCGVLTTGYDESTIQCVIMNRATQSLALFLQCFGRASRPWMGCINNFYTKEDRKEAIINSPKPKFIGLDFGMNHTRHGMWNSGRVWELAPPRKKKDGVAPVKECGNLECGCIISASATKCPECGYEFPVKEKLLLEGVMVEVLPKAPERLIGNKMSSLSIDDLLELEASKKYKSSYIWRIVRSLGEDAIKEYAKVKGYKYGWVQRQIKDIDNSAYKDYVIL